MLKKNVEKKNPKVENAVSRGGFFRTVGQQLGLREEHVGEVFTNTLNVHEI